MSFSLLVWTTSGGRSWLVDAGDGNERQAHVTHLVQQSVQRSLIGDQAVKNGGAIAAVGQNQTVEPSGPMVFQVSLDADLVPPRLVCGRYPAHLAPSAVYLCGRCWAWIWAARLVLIES